MCIHTCIHAYFYIYICVYERGGGQFFSTRVRNFCIVCSAGVFAVLECLQCWSVCSAGVFAVLECRICPHPAQVVCSCGCQSGLQAVVQQLEQHVPTLIAVRS